MLSVLRFALTFAAKAVDLRKIEFEFELEFLVVNPRFARNSLRKISNQGHWCLHSVFCAPRGVHRRAASSAPKRALTPAHGWVLWLVGLER